MVLQLPVVTVPWTSLEKNESRSLEGECCSGGAVVIIETVRTQAGVTVLALIQPGLADGPVQAPMVHAAEELDVAVVSSPGDLACFCPGTVADVGRSSILTPASVLTRLTLTLVDVDFTQLTCRKTPGQVQWLLVLLSLKVLLTKQPRLEKNASFLCGEELGDVLRGPALRC